MSAPRRVLFVHASAELYGSDRVLLDLIADLDRERVAPRVALPRWGPLADRFVALGVDVQVLPVGKLTRAQLRGFGPLRLGRALLSAVRAFDRAFSPASVDLVHSNTLAAVGGALWARRHRIPHVWHLHEIVEEPAWAAQALTGLPALLAQAVVCNSEATRRWLVDRRPSLGARSEVVPVARPRPPRDPVAGSALRQALGLKPDALLVALVGRISPRKGQTVLLEAAERVAKQHPRPHPPHPSHPSHPSHTDRLVYAIAGDPPPGRGAWEEALRRRLAASPCRDRFHLLGFRGDVWSLWDACDVAVVPSRRPESFGLVALEAMQAGKPVIASATGALPDLIVDGETGLLVPPNDARALAAALARLAGDTALRERLGAAAQEAVRAGGGGDLAARKVEALHARLTQG